MTDPNKTLNVKVLQVAKTTIEWQESGVAATKLEKGAIGVEFAENGETYAKVGDGTKTWPELPYLTDPTVDEKLETIMNNSKLKGVCTKSELDQKTTGNEVGDIWLVTDSEDTEPADGKTYTQYIWISKDGTSAPEWVPIGSTTAPYEPEIAGVGVDGTLGCIRVGSHLKIDDATGVLSVDIKVLKDDTSDGGVLVPTPSDEDKEKGRVLSASGDWIDAVDAELGETVEQVQQDLTDLTERVEAVETGLTDLANDVDQIQDDLENKYISTDDFVKLVCCL